MCNTLGEFWNVAYSTTLISESIEELDVQIVVFDNDNKFIAHTLSQIVRLVLMQEAVKKSWSINSPRTLKRLAMAGFVLRHWGEPVLKVNPRLLWPFGWWFASPHYRTLYGSGAITAGAWVTICQAASTLLCQLW